jgi:hypothetical protein
MVFGHPINTPACKLLLRKINYANTNNYFRFFWSFMPIGGFME